MIVVCKKYRLIDKSDGKFKINEMRKELRSSVKIDEIYVEAQNKLAKTSGIYYEVDKKATEERNKSLEPKPDRKALIAEANDMGLEFAKNIKTDQLIALIEENK